MKISQLKITIKEAVKEAIREEMKEILLEAVKSPTPTVYENKIHTPEVTPPSPTNPVATKTRAELREGYRNVLGETAAQFNTNMINQPLQVTNTDTMSEGSSLPQGNVSMDQISKFIRK